MSETKPSISAMANHIKVALEDWIKKEATARWEAMKKEFGERMDRERDKEIAAAVLNVAGWVSYRDMDEHLVIEVRKVDKQEAR